MTADTQENAPSVPADPNSPAEAEAPMMDAYISPEPDDDEEDDDDAFDEEDYAKAEAAQSPPPTVDFDLASTDALTFTDLERGRRNVFESPRHARAFAATVEEMSATGDAGRRRGFGYWMLGQYERCVEQLAPYDSDTGTPESVTAAYTRARALMALHRFDEAVAIFQRVTEAHSSHPRPRAGWLEAELEARAAKNPEDADTIAAEVEAKVTSAPGGFADTSDGRYVLARVCELRRDWETALDHYAAARESEPDHRPTLMRFGYLAERCGLDEIALDCYQTLVDLGNPDRGVLINLGILYEDMGRDADAAACYDIVLSNDGTNEHARLHLTDAKAGMSMYYDEDLEKKEDRLNQILRIPITDFELSVRARNCLNKMQINTLGDLVQRSEQELLSYKNFGETSLTEIKEILHSKGLRLGMPRDEAVASIEAHASRTASGDRSNVLNKPLLELQLSIRARRTVETLGCLTVGDTIKHSAEELLGMPNFGQTSLQELRSKLGELGLKLKGD